MEAIAGTVTCEDKDGVRTLTLDRAEKKNALTTAMWTALAEGLEGAEAAGNGVVLITGRGAAFTAGNDLKDFLEHPPEDEHAPVFRCLRALATLRLPLIAAVRGPAVGVGTTLLLHCDLVFAAPDSKFKLPFVDLGLVPEAASSLLLPRRIGHARAGALLLLGESFSAADAESWGLITRQVADDRLDQTALEAARTIAAKPRQAVLATKQLLCHDQSERIAAVNREGEVFRALLNAPEAKAALARFFKK